MNSISSRNTRGRHSVLTIVTSLALSLQANCLKAQVLVVDAPATAVNSAGFSSQLAKTVAQYTLQIEQRTTQIRAYASQLMQYEQQIQQYQQLLMTVEGLGTNISFTTNKLAPITNPNGLIDQNCPTSDPESLASGLVSSAISAINSSQPITRSQHIICAQITMIEINQYNKTIEVSNTLDQYGTTLQKLNTLANEINSLGSAGGASAQAETYSATVAYSVEHWQTQMQGDEKLIAALRQQQGILAKVAMRGQSTVVGSFVQAAVLKAWFANNKYKQD